MEFHHKGVAVYFRLLLQALQAGVEIHYIDFAESSADPDENTLRLVEAIADARLTPIPRHACPRRRPSRPEGHSRGPNRPSPAMAILRC